MHNEIKYSKESIATARLILRLAIPEDAEAIFAYRSHPVTNRYQGWIPASVEEVREALKANTPDRPDRWLQFAIVEATENKVIGDVSMHYTSATQMQAEIGCALDRRYHRQGYAEEAVSALLDYLFRMLQLHRVEVSIDPRNVATTRLAERLGFRKEGLLLENFWLRGEWVDSVVYAILQREWKGL